MSEIGDYEIYDNSEELDPIDLKKNRTKSKIKNKANKSKIPILDSTCISSNTYDYEKLMSLVSPKRVKDTFDVESKRLNALATPKRQNFDLPERLLFYQQLSDNRTRFKKIEQENKEMENCTFSPKINANNPRRSFSKFLEHQKDFQKIKRMKLDKKKMVLVKERQKNNDLSPKIEISPGSQKIITQKPPQKSVHERLYQDSKTYKKNLSIFTGEIHSPCYSPDYKSAKLYFSKEKSMSDITDDQKSPSLHMVPKK